MSTFLVLVGFFGFLFGVCFLVYSFFSKKKHSKKKIGIGILAAFIAMVIGVALAPSTSEQADAHKNIETSSVSSSSANREKEEKKAKELAKKKKAKEQKAKKEAEKKQQQEQKAKEEAEKKQQEAKLKADQEAKKQEEINQKTSAAQTILAQAEANPTRDNYHAAASAIQSIPGGNQELSNRLANVDSTIKSNEAAEAERQKQQAAEAQRQAQEQQAAEAQRQAQEQQAAEAQRQAQEQQAAEAQPQAEQQNNSYTVDGQWSVAANGMVFARSDSGKYYSRVTNPANYQYMTQIDADNAGYVRAPRGNQYARP